jgi:hypothetical protein
MHSETDHRAPVDADATLHGILALLVADLESRGPRDPRRVAKILADAGLGDDQIGAVTGRDAHGVRALIDAAAELPPAGREQSVIDRARETLIRRSKG